MEDNSPIDDRPFRIPPIVWVLSIGLVVAPLAIFVFNVAVKTVVYYGFFALTMGSHFFMHGAHGGTVGMAGTSVAQHWIILTQPRTNNPSPLAVVTRV